MASEDFIRNRTGDWHLGPSYRSNLAGPRLPSLKQLSEQKILNAQEPTVHGGDLLQ